MKVLFLSEWYPSEKDQMAGLFVQKHAQAVAAQGCEVRVNTWWPQADIVQLNVLTLKKGLIAYMLKRVFGIPYIIVEHWSGYLPQNGQFERFHAWKQRLLKEIAHEASGIYPVSEVLADNMKRCGITNTTWGKINNVVDDFFYTPSSFSEAVFNPSAKRSINLLHVSCFDEAPKNVKGLLRAIKSISEKRQDFLLTLVGTGKDWQACKDYARELAIPKSLLHWTGEVTPEQVCEYMQHSECLILDSRWETYGVPLAEAMAVGIPSIESDSCGLRLPKECGVSIAPMDDEALVDAIRYMLDHYREYDAATIRSYGEQYRFEQVGKHFVEIYQETLRCK